MTVSSCTLTRSQYEQWIDDRAEEMIVNNALSQFQQTQHQSASDRLADMFLGSDEFSADPVGEIGHAEQASSLPSDEQQGEHDAFAPARQTLTRAKTFLGKVEGEDAEEISEWVERLETAIAADDLDTAAELSVELGKMIEFRCPACRAHQSLRSVCRRCATDLELLVRIHHRIDFLVGHPTPANQQKLAMLDPRRLERPC